MPPVVIPLIHPAFLWAALAVGIPVIIHLSRRRKFVSLPVGTLRFLREAERKRRFRLRVENWFLLLLRALAVVLLALLFARPHPGDVGREARGEGGTLVLLDASGSVTPKMADEARRAAQRAIRDGGEVTLAQFSDDVAEIASTDEYVPRAGAPSRFDVALDWAMDRLGAEGDDTARVVIIGHLAADALPSQAPRVWPPRVAVEVVALAPPSPENAAVRSVALMTPYFSERMEIEARVTSSSEEREVFLEAEGLRLRERVPPGIERVVFGFRPPREEVRGWISLEGDDPWPGDDRHPFAVAWTEPKQILLLDGFPGSTPFEGQAYFISKALGASGAAHGKSPFQPLVSYGMENRQGPADLEGIDAIALCGPTALSAAEARVLAAHVAAGGGLMVIPDERWTTSTAAPLVAAGLFPDGFSFTGGLGIRAAASWDREHPALADFDGRDGGDLRGLPWRDAFAARQTSGWKPLITLDGGGPVLLEKERSDESAGPVMVLAHPMTRAWTDLPREPLFVPLMKNLFGGLSRLAPPGTGAVTRTPGVREGRQPGIYTAADGSTEVIAGDPRECLVAAVEAEVFRRAFGLPESGQAMPPLAESGAAVPAERSRDGEWWPWLVAGLLALLTLECAVATRRQKISKSPDVSLA